MSKDDCPRCGGTGKRHPDDNPHCHDCRGPAIPYMVLDEVWLAAWPTYDAERRVLLRARKAGSRTFLLLCFECLSKRLGRPLRMTDFKIGLAVNAGIVLGMQLARESS